MNRWTSGTPLLDRRVAVGLDNRVRDRPVFDDAAVDEDVLRAARRPLLGQRGHVPLDAEARQRSSPPAPDRGARRRSDTADPRTSRPPASETRVRGPLVQRESDLRIPERELCDDARDLRRFARVGLQKLPARRQVVEQIADFDGRAFGTAGFLHRRDGAAVDANLRAGHVAAQPRLHDEVRDRRDAGQRFASEAERVDGGEVVGALNLARRVTLERQPRILRAHPFAIVFDAHEPLAAQLDVDLDAARARVDGVFDELFDDRGRPLDDLAGGDLVREVGGKEGDATHYG